MKKLHRVHHNFNETDIYEYSYSLVHANKKINITIKVNKISDMGIKNYANAVRKIINGGSKIA